MWRRIYRKLFSKKWELFVLGIIVMITTILSKVISVEHWISINWDLSSYSPFVPIIGLIWAVSGMLILWIRKVHVPSLWFIFVAGILYTLIMFWAIWINTGLLWEVLF